MLETLQQIGAEHALEIAEHGYVIVNHEPIDEIQRKILLSHFLTLEEIANETEGATPTERALSFTYVLLRKRLISYEDAAYIASQHLGKELTANAWRMKISRWAEKKGYPQVEQRRLRGKKTTE
jgi:hypothetical protein